MKKVSIITRAYNRLEYTVKCIDSLKKNTNYPNYEHIIINNNSSDGTKEWLSWISKSNIEYFNKIKIVNNEINLGDWGGLLEGINHVHEDSEYFVQLDNDVVINDPDWINKMIFVLENTNYNIVQLKRIGVKTVVPVHQQQAINYKNNDLTFGQIERPVACFMLKTADFKKHYNYLKNSDFFSGKTILSRLLGGTIKITNLYCNILDGYDGVNHLNYEKYSSDLKINNVKVIQELK